jgi:hypothetical protein
MRSIAVNDALQSKWQYVLDSLGRCLSIGRKQWDKKLRNADGKEKPLNLHGRFPHNALAAPPLRAARWAAIL